MTDQDWNNPGTASLGLFLAGLGINDVDENGEPYVDDDFFLILNGSETDLPFALPQASVGGHDTRWRLLVDTNDDNANETKVLGETTQVVARSLKLFTHLTDRDVKVAPFSIR